MTCVCVMSFSNSIHTSIKRVYHEVNFAVRIFGFRVEEVKRIYNINTGKSVLIIITLRLGKQPIILRSYSYYQSERF